MTKDPPTPGGASAEGTVTFAKSRPWIAVPLALAALAWALGATGYRYALARTAARTAEQSWAHRLHALLEDVPDAAGIRALGALVAAGTFGLVALALVVVAVARRSSESRPDARHGLFAAAVCGPMLLPPIVAWLSGVPTAPCAVALVVSLALLVAVSVTAALAADARGAARMVSASACAAMGVLALGALLSSSSLAAAFGAPPMSGPQLASAATALRGAFVAVIVARVAAALVLVGVVGLVVFQKRTGPRLGARDLLHGVVALLPLAAVLAWDVHVVAVSEELLVALGRHPLATIADLQPLRISAPSGPRLFDVDLFLTHDRALPPDGNALPLPTSDAPDPVLDAALSARVASAAERGTASDRAGAAVPVTATVDPYAAISIAPDASLPAKHLRRILRSAARAGASGAALYGQAASDPEAQAGAELPAALAVFRFRPAACVAELPTLAVLREAERDTQLLHAQITRAGPFQVVRREGAGTGFLLTPDVPLRANDLRAPAQRPARVYVEATDRATSQAWASAVCTLVARGFTPVLALDGIPGHPERAAAQ